MKTFFSKKIFSGLMVSGLIVAACLFGNAVISRAQTDVEKLETAAPSNAPAADAEAVNSGEEVVEDVPQVVDPPITKDASSTPIVIPESSDDLSNNSEASDKKEECESANDEAADKEDKGTEESASGSKFPIIGELIETVTTMFKPEWNINNDIRSATIGPVELGLEYKAPQNEKVTITFTKLPESPGNITIKEVMLTAEEQAAIDAISDKAYEITSDMMNGSFEFKLTLPYADKNGDGNADTLQGDIDPGKIEAVFFENEEDLVRDNMQIIEKIDNIDKRRNLLEINSINHFTIFTLVADMQGPNVASIEADPQTIDTSDENQNVTLTMRITDDSAGLKYASVGFTSASGKQTHDASFSYDSYQGTYYQYVDNQYVEVPMTGNDEDGTYKIEMVIPKFSEAGIWTLSYIYLSDKSDNTTYISADFNPDAFPFTVQIFNSATTSDTDAPFLDSIDVAPSVINTSNSEQRVRVVVKITDDVVGLDDFSIAFKAPSGNQILNASFWYDQYRKTFVQYENNNYQEIIRTGDKLEGSYEFSLIFPQGSELGVWTPSSIYLSDAVGNRIESTDDLYLRGVHRSLEIENTMDDPDSAPPSLAAFNFNPKEIYTYDDAQTVEVTYRVIDDGSGIGTDRGEFRACEIEFISPYGGRVKSEASDTLLVERDGILDGTFKSNVIFPKYSDIGNWNAYVYLTDNEGNSRYLEPMDLQKIGFPSALHNSASLNDQAGPILESITVDPQMIDTSSGEQVVTVKIHVKDDIVGLNNVDIRFLSPSKTQHISSDFSYDQYQKEYYQYVGNTREKVKMNGNGMDGNYEFKVVFPRYSERGVWQLGEIQVTDRIYNGSEYSEENNDNGLNVEQSHITNSASIDDVSSPELRSLSIDPNIIDTSQENQSIMLNLGITDELAGVQTGYVVFKSPSGNHRQYAYFYVDIYSQQAYQYNHSSIENILLSGDNHDGQYGIHLVIPRYSESGIWTLDSIVLSDQLNNIREYSTENNYEGLGDSVAKEFNNIASVQDVEAPAIEALDFSREVIDTSAGEQQVVLTMHLKDALAGMQTISLGIESPSGEDYHGCYIYFNEYGNPILEGCPDTIMQGDYHEGIFEVTITFPQGSEVGYWKLVGVYSDDQLQNYKFYDEYDFETMHFPKFIANGVNPDTIAPTTTVTLDGEGNPDAFQSNVEVTFSAEDNEGGVGVMKTEYSLDGGASWEEYEESFSVTGFGEHTVQYRSIDELFNVEEVKTEIFTIGPDTTPPYIRYMKTKPGYLWPPKHQMIPVFLYVVPRDNFDESPVCKITSVSANLKENPNTKLGKLVDWEITGDLTANLRSEYPALLWYKGRIYSLEVICTDASGNTIVETEQIGVGSHWKWEWEDFQR